MDASQITTAQRITVIKHSLNGRDDDFIATATRLAPGVINHILDAAGSPNQGQMRRLLEHLEKAPADPPTTAPTRVPNTSPRLTGTAARPASTPAPTPAAVRVVGTSANELIHQAAQSSKARTRNLGAKVAGLIGDLQQLLRAEREEEEAKAEAAATKARNAKRIAELEAELATLKGAKPKAPTPTSTGDITAKTIRVWAAENSIPCPANGRVPRDVRHAYEQAHSEATQQAS